MSSETAQESGTIVADFAKVKLDYQKVEEYNRVGVKGLLMRVALISGYFARSTIANNALRDYQKAANIEYTPITSYSPTRWGGMYLALLKYHKALRIGRLRPFLNEFLGKDARRNKKLLTVVSKIGDDQEMIKQLICVLQPYYAFTKKSQERNISLGESMIEALSMVSDMLSDNIKSINDDGNPIIATDGSGEALVEKGKQVYVQFPAHTLLSEVFEFRQSMLNSLRSRLFCESDDQKYVSVLLSPSLRFQYRALTFGNAKDNLRKFLEDSNWEPCIAVANDPMPPLFKGKKVAEKIIIKKIKEVMLARRVGNVGEIQVVEDTSQVNTSSTSSSDLIDEFIIKRPKTSDVRTDNVDRAAQEEYARFVALAEVYERRSEIPGTREFYMTNKAALSNLVHVYLQNATARPSSSHLESYFSIAGNIMSDTRTNLGEDLFLACVGLKISGSFSIQSAIRSMGLKLKSGEKKVAANDEIDISEEVKSNVEVQAHESSDDNDDADAEADEQVEQDDYFSDSEYSSEF